VGGGEYILINRKLNTGAFLKLTSQHKCLKPFSNSWTVLINTLNTWDNISLIL